MKLGSSSCRNLELTSFPMSSALICSSVHRRLISLHNIDPCEQQAEGEGYSDDGDILDPYDELGRTPPRQMAARNRKWSSDKKFMRENEKR